MTRNNRMLEDAVDAILSLKDSHKLRLSDPMKGCTVILVGNNWKHHVKSTFFGVKDSGSRITCEFLGAGKIWVLKVEEGQSTVDQTELNEGETISLRENSLVKVGGLYFRFTPLSRIERMPKSYKKIIIEAIKSSPSEKLSLAEIYHYFEKHYGFAQEDSATWKNSIRHNLSINNMFQRVPRDDGSTSIKGMLWTVVGVREERADGPFPEFAGPGAGEGLARTLFREEKKPSFVFEPPWRRRKKRRLSEDDYPCKKFKQTIIPRVTGYMSIPVSYEAKRSEDSNISDVSYEVPDFSSEYSNDMFSLGGNSDGQESQNSHNEIFDMSESVSRGCRHRRGRKYPR